MIDKAHQGYKATPERAAKDDYEGGKKRYRCATLYRLHQAEKVDGDAYNIALKWVRDFIFGYYAYADFLCQSLGKGHVRGDIHTFALSRGKACARIDEARVAIGRKGHVLLVLVLIANVSPTVIAREMYPKISEQAGRPKVTARVIEALEKLRDYEKDKRTQAKQERRLQKIEN